MTDVDADDAISALHRLEFDFFLRMAFAELGGDGAYIHGWYIDAIIRQLDRVRLGENRRLAVTIPPRHLKSRIISVAWVAWMLGHNPALSFLWVSYGQDLSEDYSRDCLKLIQSSWYRRAFPSLKLVSRSVSHFRTSAGGGGQATSTDGVTTGFGADIIIIDDPLKAQDALSPVARDKVNRWFDATVMQRLNSQTTGAIIVVMQRLHEADLIGTIRKMGGFFELCLPAIAPRGEDIPLTRGRTYRRRAGCALHPARHPLALLRARQAESPYVFAGQFQQEPIPEIGNIIEAPWFNRFDLASLNLVEGEIAMSLDTASKDNPFNDYSVILIARIHGKSIHVIDVYRKRMLFPVLEDKVIELARLHKAKVLLIEDCASGQQLIQRLYATEPAGVPSPIPWRPKGDKNSRVLGASSIIRSGRLYIPEQGHWVADFISEVIGFPGAAHDDQVDALTQALLWLQEKDMFRIPLNVGPISADDDDEDFDVLMDEWGYGSGQRDPWGP